MGLGWQCGGCGARYRVPWLSHCYRCQWRPPQAAKRRSRRMPKITREGGPSNARALPGETGHMTEQVPDAVVEPDQAVEVPAVAVVDAAPPAPVEPEPVVEPEPEPLEVAPLLGEPEPQPAPLPEDVPAADVTELAAEAAPEVTA